MNRLSAAMLAAIVLIASNAQADELRACSGLAIEGISPALAARSGIQIRIADGYVVETVVLVDGHATTTTVLTPVRNGLSQRLALEEAPRPGIAWGTVFSMVQLAGDGDVQADTWLTNTGRLAQPPVHIAFHAHCGGKS